MTTVIFRRFKDTLEIIALFPEIPADNRGNILSYMHIGQHGAADYSGVIAKTRPIQEVEYYPLYKELIQQGYDDLQVHDRRPRARQEAHK